MRKNIKVCIGLYNSNPRKNKFKEVREKINNFKKPSEFSGWSSKTQEDQIWYENNLPIEPDNMNELAVTLNKLILSMKTLVENTGIEVFTEDKEK